jgi:hypothetical protein
VATFRRVRPPSGLVHVPPPGPVAATVVLAVATPVLLFGLASALWALRPGRTERDPNPWLGTGLLVIVIALSALAAALARWA